MSTRIGGAIEMLKNFHFTARNSEEAALQALTAGLDVEASSDCYPTIPGLIERGRAEPRDSGRSCPPGIVCQIPDRSV